MAADGKDKPKKTGKAIIKKPVVKKVKAKK